MNRPYAMPIVTIDANIGAGKTTVMQWLHDHYRLPIDLEPVQSWEPYLKDIYENRKNVFMFQVRVWLDRCFPKPTGIAPCLLMERSPYFQQNIFVNIAMEQRTMSHNESMILHDLYAKIYDTWSPSLYIYLRSNPNECLRRIDHRARPSEATIEYEYLLELHRLHEQTYYEAVHKGLNAICVNVEGKTPEQIGQEIVHILKMYGYVSP